MSYRRDLTGEKYGRLTVVMYEGRNKRNKHVWRCHCECGATTFVETGGLGKTRSCGCINIMDLSGQKYGRLTVLSFAGRDKTTSKLLWKCRCDCGNEAIVKGNCLRTGNTESCGCYGREQASKANYKHGHSQRTRTYNSWVSMKDRCYYTKHKDYALYGGRGITVCPRWRRSFLNFLEDMGERPPNKTLDRIDNDKGYCKSNCRWSTPQVQVMNRRCMKKAA